MRPLTPADLLDATSWMRLRDRHRVAWLADARARRVTLGPGVDLVWLDREAVRFHLQELALASALGGPCPPPVSLLPAFNVLLQGDGALAAWVAVTDVERAPPAAPPALIVEGGAEVAGAWADERPTALRAVVFRGVPSAPVAVAWAGARAPLSDALRAALRQDLAGGAPLRALGAG
jgi:hypothetical protein